jgi:hypothetical protein
LIRRMGDRWETDSPKCAILVRPISYQIEDWYE